MMDMSVRAIVVGLAAAIGLFVQPVTASAEYRTVEHRFIGEWLLVGAVNPSGGGLCMATIMNLDGLTLTFMAEAPTHVWSLELGESAGDWQFEVGETTTVDFAIDDNRPLSPKAVSTTGRDLSILLGKEVAATDPLRRGNRILLHAAGKTFSFSLEGSARVLDAVLDCANQHLGFQGGKSIGDDSAVSSSMADRPTPTQPVNLPHDVFVDRDLPYGWTLRGFGTDARRCTIAVANNDGGLLTLEAQGPHYLSVGFINSELDRALKSETGLMKEYPITYSIDGAPVPVKAHAIFDLSFELGRSFAATAPLRRGKVIEFQTPFGDLSFDLAGSAGALDALRGCAIMYLGFEDAETSADSLAAPESVDKTTADPALRDATADATINVVKKLRMAKVIFDHDPSAESELRARLRSVLQVAPRGERAARANAEVQAFLGEKVERAMKRAPGDAMAKLIQHDRDVMRQLQSQPEACALFFKASGGGDLSALPAQVRAAQGEVYADLIEAAFERPAPATSPGSEEEMISWVVDAYATLGFPTDDLMKLGNPAALDARETCRVGNEFMTAMASLPEDRAGKLYRWIAMSGM